MKESTIGKLSDIEAAPCLHFAYQTIYQKNMEGFYEEKKVCLHCKNEVLGY